MLHLLHVRNSPTTMDFPVETLSADPVDFDNNSRHQPSESPLSRDSARILAIGDDPVLLYSRRLVLERDGYLVAASRSDAIADEEQLRGFDLIMLCHSIPDKVAGHILEVLWRVTPETPVLLVSRLDLYAPAGLHHIAVSSHPADMLDVVAQQLALHKNAGASRQS
ncbi:MAG TPA: response regulator [Bryocella sp.]|nr:response regulator [Bryocella sp.]